METISILLTAGAVVFGLMSLLWIASLIVKNASIVDIFWGFGFVILAWVYFLLAREEGLPRNYLIAGLATIWGLRLTLHILIRNWGKAEDFRYQKWRNESGKIWWIKSFFQVFLLQGLLMWLISTPLFSAQNPTAPVELGFLDIAGILLWLIGFFFEAAGDYQLSKFKSNPANKGKILQSGVWRLSRHPNYFGDAAQWWGFFLIALSAGGWWTFYSPILMTLLLIRVSGVALLEKSLKDSKPGYKEYIETTSAFIPWFPRKRGK